MVVSIYSFGTSLYLSDECCYIYVMYVAIFTGRMSLYLRDIRRYIYSYK